MITMIDMGLCNLDSVRQAFQRVGVAIHVTDKAEEIGDASAIILPGVGAFGDGMNGLKQRGLIEPIRTYALQQQGPLFGICLGMQLMLDRSEEHGTHEGLGLIAGEAVRLEPESREYRVPNMGWCDVHTQNASSIFSSLEHEESFYFAHSFHTICSDAQDVAATIEYDNTNITAAIQRDNLFGVQFHPEKSQDAGLNIVRAFVDHIEQAATI